MPHNGTIWQLPPGVMVIGAALRAAPLQGFGALTIKEKLCVPGTWWSDVRSLHPIFPIQQAAIFTQPISKAWRKHHCRANPPAASRLYAATTRRHTGLPG
jgi:hypothetical protein